MNVLVYGWAGVIAGFLCAGGLPRHLAAQATAPPIERFDVYQGVYGDGARASYRGVRALRDSLRRRPTVTAGCPPPAPGVTCLQIRAPNAQRDPTAGISGTAGYYASQLPLSSDVHVEQFREYVDARLESRYPFIYVNTQVGWVPTQWVRGGADSIASWRAQANQGLPEACSFEECQVIAFLFGSADSIPDSSPAASDTLIGVCSTQHFEIRCRQIAVISKGMAYIATISAYSFLATEMPPPPSPPPPPPPPPEDDMEIVIGGGNAIGMERLLNATLRALQSQVFGLGTRVRPLAIRAAISNRPSVANPRWRERVNLEVYVAPWAADSAKIGGSVWLRVNKQNTGRTVDWVESTRAQKERYVSRLKKEITERVAGYCAALTAVDSRAVVCKAR